MHWGYADPALMTDQVAQRQAFELTRQAMAYRMLQLLQLPLEQMNKAELHLLLAAIAKS